MVARDETVIRNEALEEAARLCDRGVTQQEANLKREPFNQEMHGIRIGHMRDALAIRRALKREPNAVAPGSCCAQPLPCGAENCTHPKLTSATAAPDVASMVRRLRSWAYAHPGNVPEDGSLLMDEAAALLAKLVQACKEADGYRHGYFDGATGRRPAYPLLPPAPGASDD